MNLPISFAARMQSMLGDAYPAFLAEYEKEAARAVFVPSLACDAFDFPLTPIPHLPGGFSFALEKPGNHPLHHAGAFYVQDPSAMATVSAAPLREGMRCLDLCASPGGKSVQLRAGIGSTGFLVSNEINPTRCKTLCGNMERMGFSGVQVTNADPKRIASWYPAFFDLTVVDAPCSGEGMFRKYETAAGEWSEGSPAYCAARQKEILQYAKETVAPGGYLLYSTCTFSEEENEGVVRAFLEENGAFSLIELPERLQAVSAPGIGMPFARRFYPHLAPGEGQFVALLRREGTPPAQRTTAFADARQVIPMGDLNILHDFLEKTLQKDGDLTLCAYGKYLIAADHPVPKENVFSAGVTLGTVEKRRMIPHHQLFKCYGGRFYRKIALSLEDERLRQYLSGAEIPCDCGDGWAVVTVCGLPLGGAKVSHGVAKNHYPKGLRLMNC